jgi:hypothetical protein
MNLLFKKRVGMSGNIALRVSMVSVLITVVMACSKTVNDQGPYSLSYGDSILYMKAVVGDYIVYPLVQREGDYTGFPDGIEVDSKTGAINVSKSETGLRYRITHTAPDGSKTETKVVLSGITFTDKFYHLAAGDSIALPVYNSSPSRILPLAGSSFDEGNTCNNAGCAVGTANGTINLAETVRNGVFGGIPRNDERREFEIRYRINDASGKTENKLKVLLYWYNTMADVPADLWETLNERESDGVFLRGQTTGEISQAAKPRPPCVIIIAN